MARKSQEESAGIAGSGKAKAGGRSPAGSAAGVAAGAAAAPAGRGKGPASAKSAGIHRTAGPAATPSPPTATLRDRARRILAGLAKAYPDAKCALDHRGPLDLYVATVLSAQCTDERVNQVTPTLFARCRRPEDYLALGPAGLEELIRSTGFFRNKAKSILGGCRVLVEEFGGTMPGTMDELLRLPGVGRKTANVILGEAFDTPGITVDTHVGRLARRMGLTRENDPVKVEFELMPLIPAPEWTRASHLLITHGRQCCTARKPECARCPVLRHCPFPGESAAS